MTNSVYWFASICKMNRSTSKFIHFPAPLPFKTREGALQIESIPSYHDRKTKMRDRVVTATESPQMSIIGELHAKPFRIAGNG